MNKHLITSETIELAKLKFFEPEQTEFYFINDRLFYEDIVPSKYIVQNWLRERCNINVWVSSKTTDKGNTIFIPHGRTIPDTISKGLLKDIIVYKSFNDWYDAFEFGLQEAIKYVNIPCNPTRSNFA